MNVGSVTLRIEKKGKCQTFCSETHLGKKIYTIKFVSVFLFFRVCVCVCVCVCACVRVLVLVSVVLVLVLVVVVVDNAITRATENLL